MKVLVNKSEIKGKVIAPSSKSYTIRALISAALANGESEIINPLASVSSEPNGFMISLSLMVRVKS